MTADPAGDRQEQCRAWLFRCDWAATGWDGMRRIAPAAPRRRCPGQVGQNGRDPGAWRPGGRRQDAQSALDKSARFRVRSGSRPISRVLSRATIHLGRASPRASSDLPGSLPNVATGAVRSYRTVSPLPSQHCCRAWAVCSLLHFPWARAPQGLPGTLLCGARTFLREIRSGCLADSHAQYTVRAPRTPAQVAGRRPSDSARS